MNKKKIFPKRTNRDKAVERKYMSYEDIPLADYRDSDPVPQNLTRKFVKVFAILFLVVVVVLALVNIDRLTPENISHWFQYELLGKTEGGGYPIRFVGTSINTENFAVIGKSPIYCSDTSVVVLNSNAGEYQNVQHSFADPIMKTNKDYAIIYNSDATGYRITNRDSTVYAGTADNKLFDADISSNGTYALLTYGNDYLSCLTINNKDNKKIYSYSFAEYYLNNVSINSKGSRAALSGISAKEGGIISAIYIIDFNQENYYQKYDIEDAYIYDLCYLDNDKVAAVGDNSLYFIDVAQKHLEQISYDSKILTTYTLKRDYGALLSLSFNPDGRDCDIIAINSDGKRETELSTETRILSLDQKNGKICALLPTKIMVYDKEGNVLISDDATDDALKACFCDSKTLYILGTGNIYKHELEYK